MPYSKLPMRAASRTSPQRFLISEWTHVVDAWQLAGAEDYATVPRTRTQEPHRREAARPALAHLRDGAPATYGPRDHHVAAALRRGDARICENGATSLSPISSSTRLRISAFPSCASLPRLRRAGRTRYSSPGTSGSAFSSSHSRGNRSELMSGGRSSTLKVNYRTSHQIRQLADRLVPTVVRDVDGLGEDRIGTVSVFNGPAPVIFVGQDEIQEITRVAAFLQEARENGIEPAEIGIFVRSRDERYRGPARPQAPPAIGR